MDPRLQQLVELLDRASDELAETTLSLPASLRDAAALAAELGLVGTTTEITIRGLRDVLEAFVQRALLDAHYREHAHVRPDLAEVAIATAELEGNPLGARPDLVRRAAEQVIKLKNDPTPDDVLLYAAGMAAAVA